MLNKQRNKRRPLARVPKSNGALTENSLPRWIVRFLNANCFTSTEIHCEISTVYESYAMLFPDIVKWCQQFQDGRIDLTDAGRKK